MTILTLLQLAASKVREVVVVRTENVLWRWENNETFDALVEQTARATALEREVEVLKRELRRTKNEKWWVEQELEDLKKEVARLGGVQGGGNVAI